MNQPSIILNGKKFTVASIWWEVGEISHITYNIGDTVDTIFGSNEFLSSLLVKEEN